MPATSSGRAGQLFIPSLSLAAAAVALLVSATPARAQTAWAAANTGRLYRNNGGASWTNGNSIVTNAGTEYGIDFINAQIGWTVGIGTAGPVILKSTNGGVAWTTQLTGGTNISYYDVDFINNFNGWVVGDTGKILATREDLIGPALSKTLDKVLAERKH